MNKPPIKPLYWVPSMEFCADKRREEEKYCRETLSSKTWKEWYPHLTNIENLIREKQYNKKQMKGLGYDWNTRINKNLYNYIWFLTEMQIANIRIEVIDKLLEEQNKKRRGR